MPPVRLSPDADAGGLPALELAWLGAGGVVAPLVPPLSPLPPVTSSTSPPTLRELLLSLTLWLYALLDAGHWSLSVMLYWLKCYDVLLPVLLLAYAKFS
jgi:hypothetical protein